MASLSTRVCSVLAVVCSAVAAQQFQVLREPAPPTWTDGWSSTSLDADGDGDLDLMWFELDIGITGKPRLALNDGHGRFVAQAPIGQGMQAAGLAAADFDGDGDADVMTGNGDLLRNQAGTFVRVPGVLTVAASSQITVADFDGDGDPDVYCNSWSSHSYFRHAGGGVFVDASASLPPVPNALCFATGDCNGDGITDLVIGTGGSGPRRVHLWLGSATGVFVDASLGQPAVTENVIAVRCGDVDGDGDLDLVLGLDLIGCVWWRNTGGTFAPAATLPLLPELAQALALADLDGDGDLDVVVGTGHRNAYDWPVTLRNDGSGLFTRGANDRFRRGGAMAVHLHDVDGDGDIDALLTTRTGFRVAFNGAGSLTETSCLPYWWQQIVWATVADFDGDRLPDIVISENDVYVRAANVTQLLRNRGDGTFTEHPTPITMGLPVGADGSRVQLLHLDFDRDGDEDLLINRFRVPLALFRNDGGGAFADVSNVLAQLPPPDSLIDVGDVDRDGDVDIVTGGRVYVNSGTGTFGAGGVLLTAFAPAVSVLGDFDADGDLDCFVGVATSANWVSHPGQLFANNGLGQFTNVSSLLPTPLHAITIAGWGDLDGDGRQDLIVDSGSNGTVWWSDPQGFSAGPTVGPLVDQFAIADVDGDGVVELIAADRIWHRAPGRQLVATPLDPRLGYYTPRMAAGDFDLDGDVDLFAMGVPRVHTNVATQLARQGPVRMGHRLGVDLWGAPGEFAALAASFGRTGTNVPGLGLLWLDPSTASFVTSLTLDASGRGTWSIPVPIFAGGFPPFFLQAGLLGTRVRLTNAEVIEVLR